MEEEAMVEEKKTMTTSTSQKNHSIFLETIPLFHHLDIQLPLETKGPSIPTSLKSQSRKTSKNGMGHLKD